MIASNSPYDFTVTFSIDKAQVKCYMFVLPVVPKKDIVMVNSMRRSPRSVQTGADIESLSKRDFDTHVAGLRRRYRVPTTVKIKRKAFESLDDLSAFMEHQDSAETRSGKPTAMTSRRTRTTSADSATAQNAIAAALAKKKTHRDAHRARRTAPAIPKSKPIPKGQTNTAPASIPISSLMSPGIYRSDPWRRVGLKDLPREIEASTAKFRRQKRGVGKCTGSKLKHVMSAFSNAYYFAESARQEVTAMRQNPDAALLWHASYKHEQASLAYWFGADYSPNRINNMLTKIETTLTEWSLAHCAGFRGLLPVWIRCKSRNGAGDGPARHLVANTIELFPRYFDMTDNLRTVTMLHEMGHRSGGLLTPRDERHDLCEGGWNRKDNMCYRDHNDVNDKNADNLFISGNPRELATAATTGNKDARKTALNNIDNYVCYMWNRHRDHQSQMMYLLSPGAKEPRRTPRATTAPSGG